MRQKQLLELVFQKLDRFWVLLYIIINIMIDFDISVLLYYH